MRWLFARRYSRVRDGAISPIIATILLIAATVVLGVTIYAATTGFGGQVPDARPTLTFRVVEYDSEGNGPADAVRVTYLEGPPGIAAVVLVTDVDGVAVEHDCPDSWDVGDSCTVPADALEPGRYVVTVASESAVVLERIVDIRE